MVGIDFVVVIVVEAADMSNAKGRKRKKRTKQRVRGIPQVNIKIMLSPSQLKTFPCAD